MLKDLLRGYAPVLYRIALGVLKPYRLHSHYAKFRRERGGMR